MSASSDPGGDATVAVSVVPTSESPAPEPAVVVDGVTKRFDTKVAVADVRLEIPSGSVFGLIGPNGAGKTTTLKMIATLIKPDEGAVRVCGYDVADSIREVRSLLGYMPDRFGTFRGLTCQEYLEYFGRTYCLHGVELHARLADVLELTELDRVRGELTSALSTGMKQRLSLAKTLLHDPQVLVLDEPASGLDPRARIEIRSLLDELGKMGKTIVISSHILADLEEICTDVGIIEQGAVVWSGPLRDAGDAAAEMTIELRVPNDEVERTVELLSAVEFARDVRTAGEGEVLLALEGRESKRGNELLRTLLEADIEVVSFRRDGFKLETFFLERTKGIVS